MQQVKNIWLKILKEFNCVYHGHHSYDRLYSDERDLSDDLHWGPYDHRNDHRRLRCYSGKMALLNREKCLKQK